MYKFVTGFKTFFLYLTGFVKIRYMSLNIFPMYLHCIRSLFIYLFIYLFFEREREIC